MKRILTWRLRLSVRPSVYDVGSSSSGYDIYRIFMKCGKELFYISFRGSVIFAKSGSVTAMLSVPVLFLICVCQNSV